MCMNSGSLFPSSLNGWVNKRTFTVGLQNVNPHSEMPDVLLVRGFQTTCNQTTQLVRLHESLPNAQPMPNSMICSPLRDCTKQIWKITPKTTMPECHANLLSTGAGLGLAACQLLEKATPAGLMFDFYCLTKILLIFDWCWEYLTEQTERELRTVTYRLWTEASCISFYWHLKSSFEVFTM